MEGKTKVYCRLPPKFFTIPYLEVIAVELTPIQEELTGKKTVFAKDTIKDFSMVNFLWERPWDHSLSHFVLGV